MNVHWYWSTTSEANRVINTCHQIANEFFSQNGFYPLPFAPSSLKENCVYLPEVNYAKIINYWKYVIDSNVDTIPVHDPHSLTSKLVPLLTNFTEPNLHTLKVQWTKYEKIIVEEIERELHLDLSGFDCTIFTTHFGTQGSFNHATDRKIRIWLRSDAHIHHLVELIVSAILRPIHRRQGLTWSESEAVIDHLINTSPIGQRLNMIEKNQFIGTIPAVRQQVSKKLIMQSQKFVRKIGAPISTPHFSIKNNLPYVNNMQIHHLTKREGVILKNLIQLQGVSLSLDTLADLMFDTDEEYSLAVLTKSIERLREKLERNGIAASCIQTERGSGYFLRT